MERAEGPELKTAPSLRGREAVFGEAEEEIRRVLLVKNNYYAVLKVTRDTPAADIRRNYLHMARLVHPDKCSHPEAGQASAVLNQAYDVLNSSVKKSLYDRYVDDTQTDKPSNMTYEEWEAQLGQQGPFVPAWMAPILRCPGGACCLLLILIPLAAITYILSLVLLCLCLPIIVLRNCLCGPPDGMQAEGDVEMGAAPGKTATGSNPDDTARRPEAKRTWAYQSY